MPGRSHTRSLTAGHGRDTGQLAQLLQNLIGNALKFRGERRPTVHVSAEREGTTWRIGVRDNGIGIEPEFHQRIFVIFQRLHSREYYAGTGIGLAICKKSSNDTPAAFG